MDAYIYQAPIWCGPCIRQLLLDQALVEADFGYSDHDPAHALQSALKVRGYKEESDYDSGELPKGPYADGGGEADTPQHCDACGVFLENPLTPDGYRYINEKLTEHARSGSGNAEALKQWAERYNAQLFTPGQAGLNDLKFEYSLEDDWGGAMRKPLLISSTSWPLGSVTAPKSGEEGP